MAQIEHSIVINRPVSDVFAFVTDFNNCPKWQPDVVGVHQSEGKVRVGSMITLRRRLRVLFYQLDINADVIDVQPNKKLEYKGTMGFFPFTASYTFEPQGRSTRVTEALDVRVWGLHAIFGGVVRGTMKRRMGRIWDNLKQLLESGSSS